MGSSSKVSYYKMLGVASNATDDEIRTAFRARILQSHHDKNPDEPSDLCYDLIEAYRILSNHETRVKYDIKRDKETRVLSDKELIEKYKTEIPFDEEVTPELIAKFRKLDDLKRKEELEVFIPSGAICYKADTLSGKFKSDILKWQNQFQSETVLDNFFDVYEKIVTKVEEVGIPFVPTKNFSCELCQRDFPSETHHWESVLVPYRDYFELPATNSKKMEERVGSLLHFFKNEKSQSLREIPPELPESLGIWDSSCWNQLPATCVKVKEFVLKLPDPDDFETTEEHVDYVQKCTWEDPVILHNISWVLNHSELEVLIEHAQQLLHSENMSELIVYVAVLAEFLGFDGYDWRNLKEKALNEADFEMSLLWTMISVKLNFSSSRQLVQLGIKSEIRRIDQAKWSRLSFLLALKEDRANLEEICNDLIQHGDHDSAISYYVQFNSLSSLLRKYSHFISTQPHIAILYRKTYYTQKLKATLSHLSDCEESEIGSILEELVEIARLLYKDPTDAFKIILRMFSERIKEPEFYPIHIKIIENLSQNVTQSNFNLILAAWHFLSMENEVDEEFLSFHSQRLVEAELEGSIKSYDFEALTLTLEKLNLRNAEGARRVVENLDQKSGLSNHERAMKLLINGTVQKIYKNWLAAISDYQEALLNTPECNYRLNPSISKLCQDPGLLEGVMAAVTGKLTQMKNSFRSHSYVEFETEENPTDFLVLSQPIPQQEFGFSELSSKIQSDEPKPPEVRDEEINTESIQPPLPANTPEVTLEKCERAIELGQGAPLSPSDAACAYLDLIETLPPNMHHGPIVMAASHFLRAINDSTDLAEAYAYRNAISELAAKLLELDDTNQARVQSCLTHKHMFSILLLVNQSLSKWSQTSSENSTCEETHQSQDVETELQNLELISSEDKYVIQKLLKSVVSLAKVEPLLNIPALTSSDLGYVEKVKTKFLQQFCSDKVSSSGLAVSSSAASPDHAYILFLEVLHGRTRSISFDSAKMALMSSILSQKGVQMETIKQFLEWPLSPTSEEGWSTPCTSSLQFHHQSIRFEAIEGFKLNLKSGQVSFLLKYGRSIFTLQDMFEIFQSGLMASKLKLLPSDSELHPHPFKNVVCDPPILAGTAYLQTLLRISRLLATFATGMEVNARPPFLCREIEIGFLDHLPDHLQYICRPLRERAVKLNDLVPTAYAFDLKVGQCFYEEMEEKDELVFRLGDMEMELRTGEGSYGPPVSLDSNHNEEFSPSKSFAQDFSSNLKELGRYFPEFERLKELAKISAVCTKLSEILDDKSYSPKIQNGIRSLGVGCCEEYSDYSWDPIDAHFVPSPACHSHSHVVDVNTSVDVSPVMVYGPTPLPSRTSEYVPIEDLLDQMFWTLQEQNDSELKVSNEDGTVFYEAAIFVEELSESDGTLLQHNLRVIDIQEKSPDSKVFLDWNGFAKIQALQPDEGAPLQKVSSTETVVGGHDSITESTESETFSSSNSSPGSELELDHAKLKPSSSTDTLDSSAQVEFSMKAVQDIEIGIKDDDESGTEKTETKNIYSGSSINVAEADNVQKSDQNGLIESENSVASIKFLFIQPDEQSESENEISEYLGYEGDEESESESKSSESDSEDSEYEAEESENGERSSEYESKDSEYESDENENVEYEEKENVLNKLSRSSSPPTIKGIQDNELYFCNFSADSAQRSQEGAFVESEIEYDLNKNERCLYIQHAQSENENQRDEKSDVAEKEHGRDEGNEIKRHENIKNSSCLPIMPLPKDESYSTVLSGDAPTRIATRLDVLVEPEDHDPITSIRFLYLMEHSINEKEDQGHNKNEDHEEKQDKEKKPSDRISSSTQIAAQISESHASECSNVDDINRAINQDAVLETGEELNPIASIRFLYLQNSLESGNEEEEENSDTSGSLTTDEVWDSESETCNLVHKGNIKKIQNPNESAESEEDPEPIASIKFLFTLRNSKGEGIDEEDEETVEEGNASDASLPGSFSDVVVTGAEALCESKILKGDFSLNDSLNNTCETAERSNMDIYKTII